MLNVFRRNPRASTIEALYGAIVAQARLPVFYLDYRVPDTVNGRLDLLMLHLALTYERLSQGGEGPRAVGQALFDRFCRDMDDHLREQGVSDLKVPKEVRGVGAAFFGRHGTYLTALQAGDMMRLAGRLEPQCLSGRSRRGGRAALGLCEGGPCSAGCPGSGSAGAGRCYLAESGSGGLDLATETRDCGPKYRFEDHDRIRTELELPNCARRGCRTGAACRPCGRRSRARGYSQKRQPARSAAVDGLFRRYSKRPRRTSHRRRSDFHHRSGMRRNSRTNGAEPR